MSKMCIGVRREDKSEWERRVPVTPQDARWLKEQHGIDVYVQPSPIRVFKEDEFIQAGAVVQEDLSICPIVVGVKEIPPDLFQPGKTYIFCLPGSPGACKDAWDEILVHQLDYRYRPCNFVEIMPRLDEHLRREKARGATV